MPLVTLHTMDFQCDCGAVAHNVPVKNQAFCQECGRKYLISLLVTREKEDQSGDGETEVLSPIEPPVGDDGVDA